MRRLVLVFLSGLIICVYPARPASAAYYKSYDYFFKNGQKALAEKDYKKALEEFEFAHLLDPSDPKAVSYINLCKRLLDEQKGVKKDYYPVLEEDTDWHQDHEIPEKFLKKDASTKFAEVVKTQSLQSDEPTFKDIKPYSEPSSNYQPVLYEPQSTSLTENEVKEPKYVDDFIETTVIETPIDVPLENEIIVLNSDIQATQPSTLIQIPFRSYKILEGQNIERFLVVEPGFIEITRIDKDRIKLEAVNRGSTIIHVWDQTQRWTFNVQVVLAKPKTQAKRQEDLYEQHAQPFTFSYYADWNSYHTGPSYSDLDRTNLNFLQRLILEGDTPYGALDSFLVYNKFDASTELTGWGFGLEGQGKTWGPFEDYNIRGGDTTKVFSPLSVPGQYFRGILLESKSFDRKIEYTYFYGRDRAIFGFLAPNVREELESFVEGARVTLFPEEDNQYSFNFARGFGEAREPFLKDEVYSLQAQRRVNGVLLAGELAYDTEDFGRLMHAEYQGDNYFLNVNLRDLDEEFANITSLPPNRGEIGGTVNLDWQLSKASVSSYLDVYKERVLPNADDPNKLNMDFNTSISVPLGRSTNWLNSIYYVYTPGELSPREYFSANTTYSTNIKVTDNFDVSAYAGAGYQRNRFDLSLTSEYDRYSLSGGFSFPIIKNLTYNAGYEYFWVDDKASGEIFRPNAFTTGLNYAKSLTDHWSINAGMFYRNEDNTEADNSFLAGEDSFITSLGATYRLNEDFEFFVDGRARNILAENPERSSQNEFDIRAGVRTTWDLPFAWDPKGQIYGYVYKDLNSNQEKDEGEYGVKDVKVRVGKQVLETDSDGYFQTNIKAKAASVAVDVNSIPDGFVFSTPAAVKVAIKNLSAQQVNFGITTQSGIYGIVYLDVNEDGKPDTGDEFFSDVVLVLDGKMRVKTDFEGTYIFNNVLPGTHELALDIESVPIEYLPKIKIKNTIELQEGTTYTFHVPLMKNAEQK